jgi:DNA-binding GntR family transcriptional regulator
MGRRAAKSSATLADKAYEQIRDKILRGEYPLGSALPRRKLATALGMSFLPVSEALQRLEHDGLVESKPRVGTRVRVPSRKDVLERYTLREALETQAARLFVENATKEQKGELERMARRMDQLYACCAEGDVEIDFLFSVRTYHMKFHLFVAECTGCALLRETIEREQVLVFNWLFDTLVNRTVLPPDFHSSLAKVLVSGDALKAGEAMRTHVRFGIASVTDTVEPQSNGWRLPKGRRRD